jgi:cytochrome c biogenesis protein CcdA
MIIPLVPMTMATITMTTLPHMSTCTTIVTAIPTGMSTIICTTMSTGMLTYRPEPTVHRSPGALCWAFISGGLLPCPSALVLLLTAVSLNRAALGMVLVVAFNLGLAGVLTSVGLLFVRGSRLLQQLPRLGTWGRPLPAASALVIMMIGIWLAAEAVSRL